MSKKGKNDAILVMTPRTGTETLTERIREILKKTLQYSTHDLVESEISVENIFDLCSKNNTKIAILTHEWLLQESEKKFALVNTITNLATIETHVVVVLKRNIKVVSNLSTEENRLVYVINELEKLKVSTMSSMTRRVFEKNIIVFTEHSQAIFHLTQMFDQKVRVN